MIQGGRNMKRIHEMEVPSGELRHVSHDICCGSFSLTIFSFPLTDPAHQDETTPPSNDDQNNDEEDKGNSMWRRGERREGEMRRCRRRDRGEEGWVNEEKGWDDDEDDEEEAGQDEQEEDRAPVVSCETWTMTNVMVRFHYPPSFPPHWHFRPDRQDKKEGEGQNDNETNHANLTTANQH